ncbi:MAG: oligosaccharide flippase family protein, partial [Anaerolineales bacterium]|nr:oligosaccharide flippase family protein [Anaerolineales bacterium]
MLTQDEKKDLTKATIRGTMWSYIAKYSGKFMVFLSTIVLARLLTQEDYGVAGYALVFISFLEVLQGVGIGPALVYYDEDPERTDTGFWLGIFVSVLLFGFTWLVAPLAGVYFQDPRAVEVTRVLALTFPLSSLNIVQDAMTRKQLAFRIRIVPDLSRAIGKGVVSILFAYLGYGY